VQVDSAGRTVGGLNVADPRSYQLLWAGGLMPSFTSEDLMREFVARGYPNAPSEAPVLYMISNKGITLDLDAVRRSVGGDGAIRFVATVEHTGHGDDGTLHYRSDFRCVVDGRTVDQADGLRPREPGHGVSVDVDAAERFLTLIVTDGGDGLSHDWVVLHRPVLEVLVEAAPGGP
jgi:hypothetical protein